MRCFSAPISGRGRVAILAATGASGVRRLTARSLPAALAAVALVVGIAAPASADTVNARPAGAGNVVSRAAVAATTAKHWSFTSASQLSSDWVAQTGHGYGVDMATADPDLVGVSGGVATLTARRATNGSWRGPRYKTKQMYQYGTFTARLKLPRGQGAWPAFWLCDAYQPSGAKTTAEIDMMEAINNTNVLYSTVHDWTGVHWQKTTTAPLSSGWHTYRLSWTKTAITFYLDGKVVRSLTRADLASWPFDTPMYLIMNVSVGGSWAGAPTASTPAALPMQVDYVDITGTTVH